MELLVHIAAPSARKDDDRVKAQARAYSEFGVANTIALQPQEFNVNEPVVDEASQMALPTVGSQDLTLSKWSPSLFLEDTQLARTALESQLITSSLDPGLHLASQDNAASPSRKSLAFESESDSPSRLSHSTSHPESSLKRLRPDPSPETAAKRARTLSSPFAPLHERAGLASGSAKAHSSPSEQAVTLSAVLCPDRRRDSTSSDDIPSQLPSTYSLSDVSPRAPHITTPLPLSSPVKPGPSTPTGASNSRKHICPPPSQSTITTSSEDARSGPANFVPAQAIDVVADRGGDDAQQASLLPESTHTSEKAKSVATSSAPIAEKPGPSARDRTSRIHATHPTLKVTESVIAMPPPPRPAVSTLHIPSTPDRPEDMAIFETLPLSITPDPPPTSIDQFKSHLTTLLGQLSQDKELSHCYERSTVHREPRQSERGYWLIRTSMWSFALQMAFWRFLQLHIKSGKLGWGVWCVREDDEIEVGVGQNGGGLGQVKVFCWGEVVKHVYLLLYVASKSKIRKSSARWIDADGEVVVQM